MLTRTPALRTAKRLQGAAHRAAATGRLQGCWLHVDQHIGNPRVSLLDRVLHEMRDVMTVAHGYCAFHADMQIDVKRKTHFSHETFLHFEHSRDRARRALNDRNDFAARRGVHHFVNGREKKPVTVGRDDRAGEKRGPVIGALPSLPAKKRDGNADKCGGRSESVAAMMPRIGLHRRARHIFAKPDHRADKEIPSR